jgi:hypothetical protein
VVLVPLAAALAGPFAVRLVLPGGMNPRYFAAALPAFLLFIASGAAASPKVRGCWAATAVLVLTMLVGSGRHLVDPGYPREDIGGATGWLDVNVPADEEILVSSDEMAYLARFHWPARRLSVYPKPGVIVTNDNVDAVASQLPFPGPDRAILILGRTWLSDPTGVLQHDLPERYRLCAGTQLRGIRILCLVRPDATDQRRVAAEPNARGTMRSSDHGGTQP